MTWLATGGALLVSLGCSSSTGTVPQASLTPSAAAEPPGEKTVSPSTATSLSPGTKLTKVTPVWSLPPLSKPSAPVETAIPKPVPVLTPHVRVGDGSSNSVGNVGSVQLIAALSELKGDHELVMELITPTQATYERRARSIKGTGSPSQEVRFELPVAGTLIQTSNLTGMWSARFLLDGHEVAAHDFELTP